MTALVNSVNGIFSALWGDIDGTLEQMEFIASKTEGKPIWLGITEREEQHVWRTVRDGIDVSDLIIWHSWGVDEYPNSIYLAGNFNLQNLKAFGAQLKGSGLKKFICHRILRLNDDDDDDD